MKKILILIITALLVADAHAADNTTLYRLAKANAFYQAKNYDSAATYYEQVTAQNPAQTTVYYNLGNAYYRLNKIGKAVLNYQRALKLEPGNTLASDNLYLTENRISNRVQALPELELVKWWKGFTKGGHATGFSVAALLVFLLLLVGIWYRKKDFMRPQYIGAIAIVWMALLPLAFVSAANNAAHNMAVVMRNDAPLVASPSQIKVQSYIPEGTTLKITAEQNGYCSVTLPDGRSGWLELAFVERI